MSRTLTIKKQDFDSILSKMSIYFQDESSFEISHKIWRVLSLSWNKPIRTNWKERRHQWLSMSWARRLDWKLIYQTSETKTWKDFLSLVYKVRYEEEKEWLVLIVDNARIHRTKKLEEYCKNRKIVIVYLPPYSPDLNPIELLRKMIKREFRKIQWTIDDIPELIKTSTNKVRKKIWNLVFADQFQIPYILS